MRHRYANLHEYLKATRTTQAQFAERVGVKQTAISRIVRGNRTPKLTLAMRIASEAQIPLESLVPSEPAA